MAAAVYKNFLTDTVLDNMTVEALRSARAPIAPIELSDADLFSYKAGPQEGTWKQLDVSGNERDFLVGLGAVIEQPTGRWLVRSSVVDALYGPAETALFRFDSAEETPTEARLERMALFLRVQVLPPYVARAQKQLKSIPDTVYDGVILRENLRTLQMLIRALEARFSAPSAEKRAP
jgi:hypothetical protein